MPSFSEGIVGAAILSGVGATTIARLTALLWIGLLVSLTVTVKFVVPVAVGVPEITPVEAPRVNPCGRLPEVIAHLYAGVPPLTCKVPE